MNKNKIGTIFMVSVLALAGIGISYAGLTDEINIYGTVTTGTVDLKITDYSGTWVWKVYEAPSEVVITHDPDYSVPPEDGFLVSHATGRDVNDDDPLNDKTGEKYDAVLEFDNLFPCIDFMADIVFHYDGTIPAKVSKIDWDWVGDEVLLPDGTQIPDFIDWLWDNGHMTGGFFRCDEDGNLFDPLEPVVEGYQLHQCNFFKLIVTIHLPQENWLQGLEGKGYVSISVLQWNDQCEPEEEFDIEVIKVASDETPEFDEPFTFTITAKNLGPGDATGVVVNDLLAIDFQYISHIASKGIYDPITGDWTIGDLAAGETATLEITVEIPEVVETEYTQLALLIDGSSSISPANWNVLRDGIALAITDGYIPHNEKVELTVIQFGGWEDERSWAQVELGGPIVLTSLNYNSVAAQIQGIAQLGGGTPLSCALRLAGDVMSGDPNDYLLGTDFEGMESEHPDWLRQVVNIVTDGRPNIEYIHEERYAGSWPGGPNQYDLGQADAELALDYYMSLPIRPLGEGDEIDVEAVGLGSQPQYLTWLRDQIAQPGHYDNWPPTGPGWVRYVDDYSELANTLKEKFQLIFLQLENCATLVSPYDSNPDKTNDKDCVIIVPE